MYWADVCVSRRRCYSAVDRGLSFKLTMGNTVTLTPPLTISQQEIDRGGGSPGGMLACESIRVKSSTAERVDVSGVGADKEMAICRSQASNSPSNQVAPQFVAAGPVVGNDFAGATNKEMVSGLDQRTGKVVKPSVG